MLSTSLHLTFQNIPSLLCPCRSLFEMLFASAQSLLTLGTGRLSVMRPTSWGPQGSDAAHTGDSDFVCSSIYIPRFSQKLKPPHVWVTRYWHPVALWLSQLCCTSVTITHNCSVLLVWQGEQDDRLYEGEEIWNVRVAATRTVMFNHIPQEETFKNGYRPMVKFNKIKYLRVMTVLTYEL